MSTVGSFSVKKESTMYTGCRCPGAGSGLRGGVYEQRPGLRHARHSRFQPAPSNPPERTAEIHIYNGGTLEKACVRKGKSVPGSER